MVKSLRIAHMYPECLNLYGDSGNCIVLEKRLAWRGIQAEVIPVSLGDSIDFASCDIVFIGGGSDREQKIVCNELLAHKKNLKAYVEDGGCLLAVCGGYQLLGQSYVMGQDTLEGLGIVDMQTTRGGTRLIGNIAIQTSFFETPVVGFENHGGYTVLSENVKPLGRVMAGYGNDGASGYEGCHYNNVIGTYIHGPLLPKNPMLADYILQTALQRRYGSFTLDPLDDAVENEANVYMCHRLIKQ